MMHIEGVAMEPKTGAVQTSTVAAIEYETLAFSRHLATAVGRSRRDRVVLESSAYTLMTLIDEGGPLSIGDLSDITGLDLSTINRQTAALTRDGLVVRGPSATGGTARVFRLTAKGERLLREEQQESRAALAKTLSTWTDADRVALRRMLRKLNETIEEGYARPWPREREGTAT